MLVFPDSVIQFFKNVPLSPSGVDKVWYGTEAQKDAAFTALHSGAYGSGSVASCSYQRENAGRVKVELPISTLYAANYMRFRNASFEGKWFYAFITAVNYINNVTTEVTYEIDYFTTWGGSFEPANCYVERQHVEDDSIGANVLEEGIPVGAYKNEGVTSETSGTLDLIISYYDEASAPSGTVSNGIYNAAVPFNAGLNPLLIEGKIADLVENNRDSRIVGVYMAPHDFVSYDPDTHVSRPVRTENTQSKPYADIDGYVPKNNKLFVYPYKFLAVDNSEGSVQEYRYEWFEGNACPFYIRGVVTASAELTLVPRNYAGASENLNARIGMKQFPQCPYPVDTYKAYLAQQNAYLPQQTESIRRTAGISAGGAMLTAGLSGAMTGAGVGSVAGGVGAIPGAIIGGAGSAAAAGFSSLVNSKIAEEKAIAENLVKNEVRPQGELEIKGSATSDAIAAARLKGFYFYKRCITAAVARSIDEYFSLFGYKISRQRVFNMRARETWTYIQTIGCNVGGELPAADRAIINKMFDSGVRVWRRVEDIGNFNLSNNPVSPG